MFNEAGWPRSISVSSRAGPVRTGLLKQDSLLAAGLGTARRCALLLGNYVDANQSFRDSGSVPTKNTGHKYSGFEALRLDDIFSPCVT